MDLKVLREEQAGLIDKRICNGGCITATDAMTKAIIVEKDEEIASIIEKLKNEDTNYLVVVDENEKFLGGISVEKLIKIIAQTSLDEPLVKILDIGYRRGINYTTANDHLEKNSNVVKFDDSILDILKLINKKGFTYIPVIDKDKKIIGLITPSSLLNLLRKH